MSVEPSSTHRAGEARSAVEGNEGLEKFVAGRDDSLAAQWMVDSWPSSLQQLKEYHASGTVTSARLHDTAAFASPLSDWIYGEALEWLSSEKIPLWASIQDSDVADLVALLRQFPDLDTVLVGAHQNHAASVRPLLKILPRARLELSRYEALGQIEALKDEFGIGRLIYGSYYPRYAMGPMLFSMHCQEFDEAELALVCAGNCERASGRAVG